MSPFILLPTPVRKTSMYSRIKLDIWKAWKIFKKKKKLGIGSLYQLFVPIPFQSFWSPYFDIFQQGLYMSVSFKAPYYLYQSPRAESLSSWWPSRKWTKKANQTCRHRRQFCAGGVIYQDIFKRYVLNIVKIVMWSLWSEKQISKLDHKTNHHLKAMQHKYQNTVKLLHEEVELLQF